MRTSNSGVNFADSTQAFGIDMKLIGHWIDLAAYYEGNDGNVWMYHTSGRSWINQGPAEAFKKRLAAGNIRGKLL